MLRVPGVYNMQNALAALVVADRLGVPLGASLSGLASFTGASRRFEVRGQEGGVTVIDDYAHHPTAIRMTLAAARAAYPGAKIWAVWQPHTYSRTKTLLADFAQSFGGADHVIVAPIYAARETDTLGVSSAAVVATMRHPDARCARSLDEALVWLGTEVRPGDVVLTLGAGDGHLVGKWLLELLEMDGQ